MTTLTDWMNKLTALALAACAAGLLVAPTIAAAAPGDDAAPDGKTKARRASDAYWSISFLGGALTPKRAMRTTHDQGLSAGGSLGWTSGSGVGIYVTGTYAPLNRNSTGDPLESFETHFGLLSLQPNYTLRWKSLRLWAGGGIGLAAERTRRIYRDVPGQRRTDYVAAVSGTAGFEIHLFSGGGLAITSGYTRLLDKIGFVKDATYQFLNVTGGLVFVFR